MKQIICDTNVWYDLPKNFTVEGSKLIPTFCNTFELTHTIKSEEYFKTAKKAIDTLHYGGYLENTYFLNPFAHLMYLDSGKGIFLESENMIIEVFKMIAENKLEKIELEKRTKPFIKDAELKEISNLFNKVISDKDNINMENNKDSAIEWTKKLITLLVSRWAESIGKKYYMKKSFDWNQIDFFLNTKALFIRKVVFNNMKYSSKDLFDLWNMVYVKPTDLYWTWEGVNRQTGKINNRLRWHNLVIEAGMEDYLFLPK